MTGDHPKSGFTLVEVLVALALVATIMSFGFAAIDAVRRAWTVSQQRERPDEVHAAAAQLRMLLSKTLPVTTIDAGDGLARQAFEGRPDGLKFVTLSESTAFWGGLMQIRLLWQDRTDSRSQAGAAVLQTAVFRSNPRRVNEDQPVVLFRDVKSIGIQYYGAIERNAPARWHSEWRSRERIPDAVLIQIERIEGVRASTLRIQVPLRTAMNF